MLRGSLRHLGGAIAGPYLGARLGVLLALLVVVATKLFDAPPPSGDYTQAEILEAIRMTESSGRAAPPDGDGGRAIGPYQIHRIYWVDAALAGSYQDCRKRDYAERVIRAYMQRWVPDAWRDCDAEVIARTHNGGPRGRFKTATDRYWRRVAKHLRARPRRPDSASD